MKNIYFFEELLMIGFVIIILKPPKHTKTFSKKMLIVHQASNRCRFAMNVLKCKMSAKRDPRKLKRDTYYTIFRPIQLISSGHSVISICLLECFEIKRTLLLITNDISQFYIISNLNSQHFQYLFYCTICLMNG